MKEKKFLKQTGIIAIGVTFSLLSLWFLFSELSLGYLGGPPSGVDIGINSRATQQTNIQPSGTTGTFVTRYGTQGVSGSGTAGYMSGTDTDFPRSEWTPATGKLNFIGVAGFDIMLQIDGIDIPLTGSLSTKLDAVGGVGTGNTFNNPTLAGIGTHTATLRANGLDITPAEYASLDNATGELQAQITETKGSVTNHVHSGSDGTAQISHDKIIGTGTNSHPIIDTFIASKAQASGVASLDASSLVVQNPASASKTPGTSTIVMTGTNTDRIADTYLSDNITKLGTPTTDNISEGSTNKYYTDARVNSVIGSSSVGSRLNEQVVSVADGHHFVYDSGSGKWKNATSTASIGFGGVTGSATDNTNFSQTPQANKVKVPVTDNSGKLTWNWLGGITGSVTTSIGTTVGVTDPNSILLLHFDSTSGTTTFKNDGYGTMTITAQNGAAISTVQKKFGVSSSLYDGVNDNAVVATSPLFTLAAGSKWDFSVELNPTNIGDDDGIFAFKSDKIQVYFRSGTMRTLLGTTTTSSTLPPTGQWTQLYISYDGVIGRIFRGGIQLGTATLSDTYVFDDGGLGLLIGEETTGASLYMYDGYMDELRFRVNPTTNFYTSNFGSTTAAYGGPVAYNEDTLTLLDPNENITVLKFTTPGTATAEPSYTFFPGSVTVFGLGTNTAIKATATVYSGWFDGAVRGTAFNIASTEKIKENITPIEIEPTILHAEAGAKKKYLADNKIAWITANKAAYTSTINEVGTGMVTYVDMVTMEKDYAGYIELQWASDLNQNTLIANFQKEHGKIFWQKFNFMQPKSWNPTDKPYLTRRGFIVEESPDEIKGDDKETIDPMAILAIQQKVLQFMKAELGSARDEIGSLTTALENQKIVYNEEVDNLYKLINVIIVSLLAVGGISGWSTIRRKRKGT